MGTGQAISTTVKVNAKNTGCAAAAFGAVALISLWMGLLSLRSAARPFLSYEETTCTILEKRLDSHLSKSKKGRATTMYTPQLTFTYEVDGVRFQKTGYSGMEISSGSREAEQAVLDSFDVGKAYRCWYDPSRPSEGVLARAQPMSLVVSGFPMIFAAAFGFATYMLLGIGKSPRRRARGKAAPRKRASSRGMELAGRSKSGREVLGLAAFGVIWNGVVGIFVTLMITRPPKDMPIWAMGVIGLFALIGVSLLFGAVSQALRVLRGKRPGLELDSDHLRPRESLSGRLLLRGPQPPRSVALFLVATETVTTTRRTSKGTSTTVRTEDRHEQPILEVEPGRILSGETIERDFAAMLPAELEHREWSWSLQVRTSLESGPPLVHEFPLDHLIEG